MKIKWQNHSKEINGRFTVEGFTKARYNNKYFRFYITPISYNNEIVYELTAGCGVNGLIASSYNKKDLKQIAQEIDDGNLELKLQLK